MMHRKKITLHQHLICLINGWNKISIRVFQDGKWKSLFLSEIKDGKQILEWIISSKGRLWDD